MHVRRRLQEGVMLLEALIAILIFSVGILALVALQGTAISYVSDAKYRTDASFLVNDLISQIWVDRANLANYDYRSGGTPPTALTSWIARVNSALPQSDTNPPYVAVDTATGTVDVIVYWRQPSASSSSAPRKYEAVSVIASP